MSRLHTLDAGKSRKARRSRADGVSGWVASGNELSARQAVTLMVSVSGLSVEEGGQDSFFTTPPSLGWTGVGVDDDWHVLLHHAPQCWRPSAQAGEVATE